MTTTLPAQPLDALQPADAAEARDSAIAVSVEQVAVTFPGGIEALRQVNLDIPAGQHVAVLGNSGSGKTTLLRCLSGVLTPTAGRIACRGRIAIIHQDLRLVKQRSALQNVLHGAMGRLPLWQSVVRFPKAERARALALLARVGLGHRPHARVGRLSGGEQQRVAIARALMQEPRILLADEPVAALDKNTAEGIMQLLRSLNQDGNLTIISVLHDCSLAENYADRIVGLDEGKITYDALPGQGTTFQPCQACKVIASTTAQPLNNTALPTHDPNRLGALGFVALVLVAGSVYAWALSGLDVSQRQLEGMMPGLRTFLGDLWPTWSQLRIIPWGELGRSLLETIQMSLIGTTLGVLISWPMAALASRNVGPRWLFGPMRFVLNTIRTVPSLIWALFFVAAVGFGPLAGALALVAYSIGYLTKFFYEAFEATEPGPQGALREIGASGPQRFLHAVWPAAKPAVLSSSLFMFEYNVRAASVLGVVDAGGIGFYLEQYFSYRQFTGAMVCLAMLLAVVVVLDTISTRVRTWLIKP